MADDTPLSAGDTENVARPDDDVINLRSLLGNEFVEWVLAIGPAAILSAKQLEAASALANTLRAYSAKNPNLPIGFMAPWLASYHEPSGTTFINYCRRYAGGSIEEPQDSSPDRLLSALLAFAGECYGEMLLPTDRGSGSPDFFHYAKTDAGKNVVKAIYDERIFPVGDPSDYDIAPGDVGADFVLSFRPGRYASGLIWAAWNLAKLDVGNPTLAQLTAKIPVALDQLRSCFTGQVTKVTAVASLTGVRLPGDTEISGTWGRLRPARATDHPSTLRPLVDKRTITTTEAGDQVEITDAGDVIFETNVSIQVHVNDSAMEWRSEGLEDFGELIDKVRLAFTLAVARPAARPIIYTMWATTILPMGNMDPRPLTDPQFMASRIPTLLSTDEIAAWEHWIGIITAADMSRMKVAMTRTLRAMTERRDPSDRLIDAVIAWESLFGASNESTLRVSASLARLLHASGEERESAQEAYRKIYQARSDIVHANATKTTIGQIDQHGRDAIEASLKAMRLILTTHNKLLSLQSSMRSRQVLLGDDSTANTATPSPSENEQTEEALSSG